MLVEPYWSSPLQSLYRTLLDDAGNLVIDFGDDDPLAFQVQVGGMFSGNLTIISKGELPAWVEQANRYLKLVHGNASDLELFRQFARTQRRGGYLAVERLIARLHDEDAECRSEVIRALQRIDGPRASQVVAEYQTQ